MAELFTPAEDAAIIEVYKAWGGRNGWVGAAVRATGRPNHSVIRRKRYLVTAGLWPGAESVLRKPDPAGMPDPPPPMPPPIDPLVAEQERIERARVIRQEKQDLKDVAGEKSLRSYLEALVREAAQEFGPPPKYKTPARRKADSVEETLLFKLSDWHAYELVDEERTRGFNAYNSELFGRRVRHIIESGISIKQRMERGGGWRFPRAVIGVNGDLVSGTIHEVERHSDAPSIVHAVYGCGMVLAQAIRDIAAEFESVEVFWSPGNHGRLPDAKRMQQKDPWRSWDALITLFAKEHLRQLDHVKFYMPNSYSVAFDVEGWRFLQTHGHDVKSWNSIPWYGLNRLVTNINALEASRSRPIHYYLFGHFHSNSSLPHAAGESFINGSLIGGTEFSINALGKSDKPGQWMLGVHKEQGVTHRWFLRADGSAELVPYEVQPWIHSL